ncbi:MAG: SGNH/GDSL hydrolase family protein [Chitinophagales bacterium]
MSKAGLALMAVLLSLLTAEIVLEQWNKEPDLLYVWQPNLKHTFYPDSGIIKGIYGPQQFTINAKGMRGELFTRATQNYLCIGGSTTECLYLDDRKTWFAELQKILLEDKRQVEIAGIGKSGTTSRENYLHIKYFAIHQKPLNGVIVMVGINDMYQRLNRDTLFDNQFAFTKAIEDSLVNTIFLHPSAAKGWRGLQLVQLVQRAIYRKQGVNWQLQDDNGKYLAALRLKRFNAPKLDSLPNMQIALAQFERNLDSMIATAARAHLQLIFVTQSALYHTNMDTTEQRLLWMGGKNDFQNNTTAAYYTPEALRKGLEMYNAKVKEVAQRAGITVVDLDAELPHTAEMFYDDCHFTEAGAEKVAEIIASHFPK